MEEEGREKGKNVIGGQRGAIDSLNEERENGFATSDSPLSRRLPPA